MSDDPYCSPKKTIVNWLADIKQADESVQVEIDTAPVGVGASSEQLPSRQSATCSERVHRSLVNGKRSRQQVDTDQKDQEAPKRCNRLEDSRYTAIGTLRNYGTADQMGKKRKLHHSSSIISHYTPALHQGRLQNQERGHQNRHERESLSEENEDDDRQRSRPSSDASTATTVSEALPLKTYGRRPRRKTRDDRYNLKQGKGTAPPRVTKEGKRKKCRKQKSASNLLKNFSADNVGAERLTLNPVTKVGLFNKGYASLPVKRRGLPDLSFSELKFLTAGTAKTAVACVDVEREKKRQKKRASYTENAISRFFQAENQASEKQRQDTDRSGIRDVINQRNTSVRDLRKSAYASTGSSEPTTDIPGRPFLGFGKPGPRPSSPDCLREIHGTTQSTARKSRRHSASSKACYFTWTTTSQGHEPSLPRITDPNVFLQSLRRGSSDVIGPSSRAHAVSRPCSPHVSERSKLDHDAVTTMEMKRNDTLSVHSHPRNDTATMSVDKASEKLVYMKRPSDQKTTDSQENAMHAVQADVPAIGEIFISTIDHIQQKLQAQTDKESKSNDLNQFTKALSELFDKWRTRIDMLLAQDCTMPARQEEPRILDQSGRAHDGARYAARGRNSESNEKEQGEEVPPREGPTMEISQIPTPCPSRAQESSNQPQIHPRRVSVVPKDLAPPIIRDLREIYQPNQKDLPRRPLSSAADHVVIKSNPIYQQQIETCKTRPEKHVMQSIAAARSYPQAPRVPYTIMSWRGNRYQRGIYDREHAAFDHPASLLQGWNNHTLRDDTVSTDSSFPVYAGGPSVDDGRLESAVDDCELQRGRAANDNCVQSEMALLSGQSYQSSLSPSLAFRLHRYERVSTKCDAVDLRMTTATNCPSNSEGCMPKLHHIPQMRLASRANHDAHAIDWHIPRPLTSHDQSSGTSAIAPADLYMRDPHLVHRHEGLFGAPTSDLRSKQPEKGVQLGEEEPAGFWRPNPLY